MPSQYTPVHDSGRDLVEHDVEADCDASDHDRGEHEHEHEHGEERARCCIHPKKLVRWNKDRTGYESVESGHRGHEWAELFFDLIFVAALVKLSALLKHESGNNPRFSVFLCALIWWSLFTAWSACTTFHTRFQIRDEFHNFIRFIHMLGVFTMAVAIEDTIQGTFGNLQLFAAGAILSRAALIFLYSSVLFFESKTFVGRTTVFMEILACVVYIINILPMWNFTNKNAHLAMFEQTTYLNGGANSSSPLYTTFTNLDAWTFCGVTRNVSSTVNGTVDSRRRLGGAPDGLAGAASMPSITAADCQMLEKLLVWWILSTHIEMFVAHLPSVFTCRCLPKRWLCGKKWRTRLNGMNAKLIPLHTEHVTGRLAELCILVIGESIIALLLTPAGGKGKTLQSAVTSLSRISNGYNATGSLTDTVQNLEAHEMHTVVVRTLQTFSQSGSDNTFGYILTLMFGFHITWGFKLAYFKQPDCHQHTHDHSSEARIRSYSRSLTHNLAQTSSQSLESGKTQNLIRNQKMARTHATQSNITGFIWIYLHPYLYFCLLLAGTAIKIMVYKIDDQSVESVHAYMLALSTFGTLCLISIMSSLHYSDGDTPKTATIIEEVLQEGTDRTVYDVVDQRDTNHPLNDICETQYGLYDPAEGSTKWYAESAIDLDMFALLLHKGRGVFTKCSSLLKALFMLMIPFTAYLASSSKSTSMSPVVFVGAMWNLVWFIRLVEFIAPDSSPISCVRNSCTSVEHSVQHTPAAVSTVFSSIVNTVSKIPGSYKTRTATEVSAPK